MYYEDGFLYEGKWSNNVKHGEGVLYNNHKALLKGYKKKSKTSINSIFQTQTKVLITQNK